MPLPDPSPPEHTPDEDGQAGTSEVMLTFLKRYLFLESPDWLQVAHELRGTSIFTGVPAGQGKDVQVQNVVRTSREHEKHSSQKCRHCFILPEPLML